MFKYNVFLGLFIFTLTSIAIYSCNKENQKPEITSGESVSTNTEMRASFCENALGNCTGPYSEKTVQITGIDSYPNCTFYLTYKFRSCDNGLDIIYIDFAYHISDPGCSTFDTDTNGPNAQAIFDQVTSELLAYAIELEGFDKARECGQSGGPMNISLFQSSCAKRCLVEIYKSEFGKGRKVVSVPCSNSGCCKMTWSVCIDPISGELETTILEKPSGIGNCTGPNTIPCPRHTIAEGVCRPACLHIGTGG
ncbi:MAG: hypothetical protein R2774_08435 [Saprospiraceae bacterium]